ncbi:hypothetical protein D3C85_1543060 [compost metagenome]
MRTNRIISFKPLPDQRLHHLSLLRQFVELYQYPSGCKSQHEEGEMPALAPAMSRSCTVDEIRFFMEVELPYMIGWIHWNMLRPFSLVFPPSSAQQIPEQGFILFYGEIIL